VPCGSGVLKSAVPCAQVRLTQIGSASVAEEFSTLLLKLWMREARVRRQRVSWLRRHLPKFAWALTRYFPWMIVCVSELLVERFNGPRGTGAPPMKWAKPGAAAVPHFGGRTLFSKLRKSARVSSAGTQRYYKTQAKRSARYTEQTFAASKKGVPTRPKVWLRPPSPGFAISSAVLPSGAWP